jgi:PKD repeat protein
LSYAWAVDGVYVGVGPTLSRTFADNGTYAVRLIVADMYGLADTTTTMVTIANVSPALGALAAATVNEGGRYTATGSFTDPGADQWTATVNYGDGSGVQPLTLTGKTFALNHAYVDDGSYTVTVTVTETDAEAGTGSRTATVTVNNVAPTVAAFAGATILRGETYGVTGSFADPGADTWTATVNYGDNSGTQSLALAAKNFSLSHTYTTAGTITGIVTVNDDDAPGSRTATVTVQSATEGAGVLAGMVQKLGADGVIDRAEANALAAKIRAAAQQLSIEEERPAGVAVLRAFINEVEAMQQSGRLPQARGDALITYARRVIASAGA